MVSACLRLSRNSLCRLAHLQAQNDLPASASHVLGLKACIPVLIRKHSVLIDVIFHLKRTRANNKIKIKTTTKNKQKKNPASQSNANAAWASMDEAFRYRDVEQPYLIRG